MTVGTGGGGGQTVATTVGCDAQAVKSNGKSAASFRIFRIGFFLPPFIDLGLRYGPLLRRCALCGYLGLEIGIFAL